MDMDPKAMDRTRALEQLEVVRPDSDDLNAPELAAAIAALEDDVQARQEFDRRQELDGKIAAAMQSVEPPAGLKEKLLAATTADVHAANNPKIEKSKPRTNRRAALISALTLCLAVAAGFALLKGDPKVNYNNIVNFAPRDIEDVANLATASSELPETPELELPLLLARKKLAPQLAWPNEDSMPPSGPNTPTSLIMGRANWVIVVTPREQVIEPPPFDKQGTFGGTLASGHVFETWQDKDFVYVLFVKGDKQDLNRVRRREFPSATA